MLRTSWRAYIAGSIILLALLTMLSVGFFMTRGNLHELAGNQISRSKEWLRIWKTKGLTGKNPSKHIMNGFSQLSKEQWDLMVCTVLQNASHGSPESLTRKVIEFGCGAGAFVESAMPCLNCTSSTCNVYGVDYSPSLVSAASSSEFWKNSRNFHRADIADVHLVQRIGINFDLILSNGVFLFLDSYEHASRVIAVMKQVLAPSGEIIISDIPDLQKRAQALEMRSRSAYYQSTQPKAIKEFNSDHLYFDKSFFHSMASKHGLRILDIVDESNLPLSFYEPSAYRFLVRMSHDLN